jgi:hypothetical protein
LGSSRGEAKSKNCEGKVTIEKVTATFLSSLTLKTTIRVIYNKVKGPIARAFVAGGGPKRRHPLSRFLKIHGLSLIYSDGVHTFWEHQGSAFVEVDGRTVFDGILQDG